MSKEAINLLKEIEKGLLQEVDIPIVELAWVTTRKVLKLLESEPEPTGFTKIVRGRLLDLHIYYNSGMHSEILADMKPTKDILEACDIIDRLTAENKKLKEQIKEIEETINYAIDGIDALRIVKDLHAVKKTLEQALKDGRG